MPGKVGHITSIRPEPGIDEAIDAAEDLDELKDVLKRIFTHAFQGRVRAVNDRTNESWGGRFIVMSGGMIVFDVVDERGLSMSDAYDPEAEPEAVFAEVDESAAGFMPRRKKREDTQPVRTGGRKR